MSRKKRSVQRKIYSFPPSNRMAVKSSHSDKSFSSACTTGFYDDKTKSQPQATAKSEPARTMGFQSAYTYPKVETRVRRNVSALTLSPLAFMKLMFMCHAFNVEVSGYGISRSEQELLYVEDFITVKQTSTVAHTEFDDNGLADFFDDMVDAGISLERCSRLWFHTHPEMSATPSGTDENTFASKFDQVPWAVMAIVSKTNDMTARLKYNSGPGIERSLEWQVDWARLPKQLAETSQVELEALWRAEFAKNVSYGTYSNYYGGGFNYSNNRSVTPSQSPAPAAGPNHFSSHSWRKASEDGKILVPEKSTSDEPPPSAIVEQNAKEVSDFFQQLKTGTGKTELAPSSPTTEVYEYSDDGISDEEWLNTAKIAEKHIASQMWPVTDAEVFNKFVDGHDWVADEKNNIYVDRFECTAAGTIPLDRVNESLVNAWNTTCQTFRELYKDIEIPDATRHFRTLWLDSSKAPTESEICLPPQQQQPQPPPQAQDQPSSPIETSVRETLSLTSD